MSTLLETAKKQARAIVDYAPRPLRARIEAWRRRRRVRRSYQEKLVPEEALSETFRVAVRTLIEQGGPDLPGDYIEFGVCHGTSMMCMHRVLDELGQDQIRLFGFDSFEGLPDTAETDDGGLWKPGQFDSDLDLTRRLMTEQGADWKRTFLIDGWFSETLNDETVRAHSIDGVGIVMIDCDMYLSAKEALQFVAPLIGKAAVLVFDDWGAFGGHLAEQHLGEKRAFEEFLEEQPFEIARELPAYCDHAKVFLIARRAAEQ